MRAIRRKIEKHRRAKFAKLNPPQSTVQKPWPSIRSRTWVQSDDGGGSGSGQGEGEGEGQGQGGEGDSDQEPQDPQEPSDGGDPSDEPSASADVNPVDPQEEPVEATAADANYDLDEPPEPPKVLPFFRTEGKLIIREFANWLDFVRTAQRLDLQAGWHDPKSNRGGTGPEWFGCDWDEALRLALFGWPAGRKMMSQVLQSIMPKPHTHASQTLDVAGGYPMIPVAATGDPACMVVPDPDRIVVNPLVRININKALSYTIEPESVMNYGAAILSLANDLEWAGYSTELRITAQAECYPYTHRTTFIFKKAGQYLDLGRAAFAIAHPASHRRLTFAVRSQSEEIDDMGSPEDYNAPDMLNIPHIPRNLSKEEAVALIQKAAQPFLTKLNANAPTVRKEKVA